MKFAYANPARADSSKARFYHFRVEDPSKFQKGSFRTIDPGVPGHIKLIIGRPHGKKTTRTQSILVEKKYYPSQTAAKMVADEYLAHYRENPGGFMTTILGGASAGAAAGTMAAYVGHRLKRNPDKPYYQNILLYRHRQKDYMPWQRLGWKPSEGITLVASYDWHEQMDDVLPRIREKTPDQITKEDLTPTFGDFKIEMDLKNPAPLPPGYGFGLEARVQHHLQYNHYPPVSSAFVSAAIEAINHARDEDLDHVIELPNGRKLSVEAIMEGLHLWDFVEPYAEE